MSKESREEYLRQNVPPEFHKRVSESTDKALEAVTEISNELITLLEKRSRAAFKELYPTVTNEKLSKVFETGVFLQFYRNYANKNGIAL